MGKSRVLVVGCGYAGEQHARGFSAAPKAELIGVCDLNEARVTSLAEKMNVPAYFSFESALAAERPDIVAITTDEYHHDELCITALEAGAHVLCEKMMAHTLEAGEQMLAAAQRTGRTLGVNYNYRHVPAYLHLRDSIQNGEIGSPRLLVAHTHAYLWHHSLDLIRFLLGEPVAVQASLGEDAELRERTYHWRNHEDLLYIPSDYASATFHFPSGAIASISSSAWIPFSDHWFSISVYGQDGAAHINHAVPTNLAGQGGPGPTSQALAAFPLFTVDDSFFASILAFAKAINDGHTPAATGEDGLAVMRMEAAVVQASHQGSRVSLER